MRRRAFLLTVAATALAFAVGSASAGTDRSLCSLNVSRGGVPQGFPLEACVDGNSIWLRNNLRFPVDLVKKGSAGKPSLVSTDISLEGLWTRQHFRKGLFLLPGDVVRFPIGSSSAGVTLSGASRAGYWAIAKTVGDFLPAGATYSAYQALAGAIAEFNDDFHQYSQCLGSHPSTLTKAKCRTILARNVAFAIGRAAVEGSLRGLASLILKPITFARWVDAQVQDVKTLTLAKHRTVQQAAATVKGHPGLIYRNEKTGASGWFGSDGRLHAIPDGGTYECLTSRGISVMNLPSAKWTQLPRASDSIACSPTITFDEQPDGVAITDQYGSTNGLIVAGPDQPYIADDSSNPTSPVLSPGPNFYGQMTLTFVDSKKQSVSAQSLHVEFDVGYIDDAGVTITWYDEAGKEMGQMLADQIGIQHVVLNGPGIHSIVIDTSQDTDGAAIDNLSF